MISAREVVTGIYGAWRLLLFDRSGLQYFDSTIDGFWKSFYAAVVALPGVLILLLLSVTANPDIAPTGSTGRIAIVFVIAYVIQWVSFPLLMFYIADLIGRNRQYITFVVAYNWSQVIQTAIILPPTIFVILVDAGQPGLGSIFFLTALIAIGVYAWFIARNALDITGIAATLIVFIDFAIAILISRGNDLMVGGI